MGDWGRGIWGKKGPRHLGEEHVFLFFLSSFLLFIDHLSPLTSPPPPLFLFHGLLLGGEVGNWTNSVGNTALLWLSSCILSSVLSVARMGGVLHGYFLGKRARGDNQIVQRMSIIIQLDGWVSRVGRNR